MDDLSRKLNETFPGYTVRKDLVRQVRGNAAVPSYVLEFLLGQNCSTDDEAQIAEGIERVKEILAQHYVQRNESGLVRSRIKEKGYQRIIDKVSVDLNERRDAYEATFENLGIKNVLVDSGTVKANQRLLVSGVWCIADLSYIANEAKDESPYILDKLKPIQLARFDFDEFVAGRSKFTAEEWLDVIIRTIGLDPEFLSHRSKLFQLTRLVAYCERNYNLIELGPKGTGKSHVFSEFSPHGILISGGEVTPAKLFVNNASGKIGLVGYWDSVAFDEFAGKQKRPNKDIVDILKNYMANKSFSRGVEQITAEASLAFVGNTSHDVGYLLRNADLFDDLPELYHDSAFLDRYHAYIPGWEMDVVRGEMFCESYGFIVDFLAEALRHLRTLDYSNGFMEHFELSRTFTTRDRDSICKTYSGLAKILFPGKNATKDEMRELLEFAMELRCRVRDQIYRIDSTFERVECSYRDRETGKTTVVSTLEESEYAAFYHLRELVPLTPVEGDDAEADAVEGEAEGAREVAGAVEGASADAGVDAAAMAVSASAIAGANAAAGAAEGAGATAAAGVAGVADAGASEGASTAAIAVGDLVPAGRRGSDTAMPDGRGAAREPLRTGLVSYRENQRGVSYDTLFGPYLDGATRIEIVDPYVRNFYQVRNVMELVETILRHRDYSVETMRVHLRTGADEYGEGARQVEYLQRVADAVAPLGVEFTWNIEEDTTQHARHLTLDNGWDILLDRGLDIFQRFDANDAFAVENGMPEMRRVKQFEVTYLRK